MPYVSRNTPFAVVGFVSQAIRIIEVRIPQTACRELLALATFLDGLVVRIDVSLYGLLESHHAVTLKPVLSHHVVRDV